MKIEAHELMEWIINVAIACLNFLTICHILYSLKSARSILLVFVLCCVLTEFVQFLVVIPHDIITYFNPKAFYPEDSVQYILSVVIQSIAWFAQLVFLPVFSILHFVAIYYPILFRKLSSGIFTAIIGSCYLITIILTIPLFTSCCGYKYYPDDRTWFFDFTKPYTFVYRTINNVLQITSLVIMILCDVVIILKLIKIKRFRKSRITVATLSETVNTFPSNKPKPAKRPCKNTSYSQEANLALRFLILSGCFLLGTASYNFFSREGFMNYIAIITRNINKAKWIFYWLCSCYQKRKYQ
ncbi:unnamed protein product [Auanema sp. JU1783]|nr:unnamed protein product [Auanema sp. JU1783]